MHSIAEEDAMSQKARVAVAVAPSALEAITRRGVTWMRSFNKSFVFGKSGV